MRNEVNPRISQLNKTGLQLSIIIVNYNVKYFLEQCLCSVLKACKDMEAEIFVVDNHSTDGSRQYLSKKFPSVFFKWNQRNDGFGKASNSVLKQTIGNYILFINPDTILAEDCFNKCLAFMDAHNNCGALGVRMIDGSGKYLKESKRSFPSPLPSFYKMIGLAALFPKSKIFARYYAGHLPQKENNEVDVLAGAFMLLSRKALDATAGFDERFFMYGEDVDLSYRIQKAGLQNWYYAGTTILHFKGESTQKLSASYIKHFYGAMLLFVKKHYSKKKIAIFFMSITIAVIKMLATVKLIFTKKSNNQSISKKLLNTAIIAGQQRFNECLHLIKYASPAFSIVGRIAINEKDQESAIGKITALVEAIIKNKIDQLIFCEGEQSFKNIIEQIESVPAHTGILLNAQHSSSMAGSNDKNSRGIFVAMQ